jgi:Concanavalin A-like lectin/glucanases superfamily
LLSALSALSSNSGSVMAAGDPYSSAVTADAPAAYWRLDQLGTAPDLVGSSTGTVNGGVTLDPTGALVSSADAALTFDGSSGYVNLPTSPVVEPTAALSVEAWIQASSLPNPAGVIRLRCNFVECGYALIVNGAAAGNTPSFYVIDPGGTPHVVTGLASVIDGKWHHIVGTKDAAGLHLYVDGSLVASVSYTGSIFYSTVTGFAIGRDADDPNFYFAGSVDEAAVYASALTSAQVANHYTVATTPVPPTTTGSCPKTKSDNDDGHSPKKGADRDGPKKSAQGRCPKGREGDSGADQDRDNHKKVQATKGRDGD